MDFFLLFEITSDILLLSLLFGVVTDSTGIMWHILRLIVRM
ncbi:MAG: hypothetical protein SOS23_05915 [Streptococcus hyovaginalis]|nr:hypothetical protein [Streptococcus hyovaginalis]